MKAQKTLRNKAIVALREAVREVIERHKRTGRPLAIWKDGKVAWVSANHLLHKLR